MAKSEKWCGCLELRTAAIAWGAIAFLSSVAGMLFILSNWFGKNEKDDDKFRHEQNEIKPKKFNVWDFLILRTYSIYVSLSFYQLTYTTVHGYANRENFKCSSVKS